MKSKYRFPESDFVHIFLKIFVIPALISLVFFFLIFNERYQNRIDNLKQAQLHHLKIASNLGKFELQNITADTRQLLHNNEIQNFLHQDTSRTRQLAELELRKFSLYQPQYIASALCTKGYRTLTKVNGEQADDIKFDFCQTTQLGNIHADELRIVPMNGTKKHDIALISIWNGDVEQPIYLQLAYDARHFIDLIGNADSHNDDFYILPSSDTTWYVKHTSSSGQEQTKSLNDYPSELQKIVSQTKGQLLTDHGLFTFGIIDLKSNIIAEKTTWKLVCHNHEISDAFQQELLYFSAVATISMIVLFTISLIYYSLSRSSRRFHMELYEDKETGFYNKKFLEAQLPLYIEQSRHFENKLICIFIDIDNFKVLVEREGPESSQDILKLIAKGIQGCVRKSDIVSRIGHDQFVILMPFIEKMYIGPRTATRVLEVLNHHISYHGREISVSASIGISNYPQHGDQLGTILTAADLAMYDVKNSSKNGYKMADAFEL